VRYAGGRRPAITTRAINSTRGTRARIAIMQSCSGATSGKCSWSGADTAARTAGCTASGASCAVAANGALAARSAYLPIKITGCSRAS
jgi:hypothetical protein